MARKRLRCSFFLALASFLVGGCERAGADYENRTAGTVCIVDELKPEELPPGYHPANEPIGLAAGQFAMSVWYISERRLIDVKTSAGRHFRFEGASLENLARQCPKQCILRITDDGVVPVRTNFFGKSD